MPSVKRHGKSYVVRGRDHAGRDRRILAPNRQIADELAAKLVTDRVRAKHGLLIETERITFGVFWVEWAMRYRASGVTESTIETLTGRAAHLASLHSLYLDEITRERLEKICAELPPSTRSRVASLARSVLRDARKRHYRVSDDVFEVSFPVPRPKDARAFTWDEVELLASFMPEPHRRAVLFAALTGLRVSELLALTDDDVFLKKVGRTTNCDSVTSDPSTGVRRNAPEGDGQGRPDHDYIVVRSSKTEAGRRTVYLTDTAATLVREQMLARPNTGRGDRVPARDQHGSSGDSSNPLPRLLFPAPSGERYTRHAFHRAFQRAGQRANLGPTNPHDLRSTCASLALERGVPIDWIAKQLGWSPATQAQMQTIYRRLYGWENEKWLAVLENVVAEKWHHGDAGAGGGVA